MKQELLPKNQFPATQAFLERSVVYACCAAYAVVWVRKKFGKARQGVRPAAASALRRG